MSAQKKNVRKNFRDAVFERDNYRCCCCGFIPVKEINIEDQLDAHHITNRTQIPYGGYVPKNGITLCKVLKTCHLKAEREEGFEAGVLYSMINSSYEEAVKQSEELLRE